MQNFIERNNTFQFTEVITHPRPLREGNFSLDLPTKENGLDGAESNLTKEAIINNSHNPLKTIITGSGEDTKPTIFEMGGDLFLVLPMVGAIH